MSTKVREEIYLEFTDGLLRLYLFTKTPGGVVLKNFFVAPCASIKEEAALEKALDLLFAKVEYAEQSIVILLPDQGCAQRYLKFPTTNEEELKPMVLNHSQHYVPFDQDELLVAHNIVKKDEEGYSTVLSLILAKSECALLLKILIDRNLIISAVYFRPLAYASLVAQKKQFPTNQESLIVYKEHNNFCFMVMLGEEIALYRTTKNISDNKELKSYIFETMAMYVQTSSAGPINNLYLCGDFVNLSELKNFLTEEFTMSIEYLDIEDWTKFPNSMKIENFAKNCVPVFAFAQDKLYDGLNLLPEKMRVKNMFWKILKRRFLLLLLWACFCFLLLITSAVKGFKLQSSLKELEKETRVQELTAVNLQLMQKNIKLSSSFQEELAYSLDFFHLLHSSFPRGIVVEKISFGQNDKKTYLVLAKAETREQVYEAVDIIKETAVFPEGQPKINYLTSIDEKGKERFIFELMFNRETVNASS